LAQVGAKGGRALAKSPHLDDVGKLRVLGSPMPSRVADALRMRFPNRRVE